MNILVTGGASGLGQSLTKKLASEPDNQVYFTYYRSADKAMALEVSYANCKGIQCDFSSETSIDKLVSGIPEYNLDVLVNNAITGFNVGYFHKQNPEDFLWGYQKNILPVIRLTQAAISHFRKRKSGKIITILSSAIVNKPPVGWSEYSAGKAYLFSLHKSWAAENSSFNITSNCISPSFMQTALTADTDERIVEQLIAKNPMKELLKVEDVSEAVAFFVNASQQINGTNLIINAAQDVI